jgi:CMP-N,N'-diacetyllegionaminic acid synthase|tara:strand:+ start:214 stop:885 length:672 start_codon:yes stop_codon:yes gene_type:complete
MSFAIIVPARKGSKSLKGKNLKKIKNIPLIEYTFKTIKEFKCNKFVLTNDNKVKKIAKKYNINENYIRPESVSLDKTSLVETLIDFTSWANKNNYKFKNIVILQATSPLRKKSDILKAIEIYKKNNFKSLFSISESVEHPYESIDVKKNKWNYVLPKAKKFYRRQDFDINSYFINGAIYIIDVQYLKKNKKLISNHHGLYYMSKINSLDINDLEDFKIAEKLI